MIENRLNVNLKHLPVKKKRRAFNTKRYEAIKAEIDKLLKADFIKSTDYPVWLSNVVLVKKANEQWQVCRDFTDLNKVCLNDYFSLPRIDQLVDATAGHRLLNFMHAYSAYN